DEEAYAIWEDVIGLPPERIVRLGKEHNWWGPVGETGPCGPDSEIFYDAGADKACGPDCPGVSCECARFSEIWNLVFMQYDMQEDGNLTSLKRKNIDTGMGLERTAAVLQGVASDFEIDLFAPIIEAIEASMPEKVEAEKLASRNLIADHIRGVVLLMADGVRPGNEKQGYVLRRVLRRAIRAGEQLELPSGTLKDLVGPVIASLGETYPEIVSARSLAERVISREEETFRKTLRSGERRLQNILKDLLSEGKTTLSGEVAFELYDTYGFPLEMTEEIAAEQGLSIDLGEFHDAMSQQQETSKEASVHISALPSVIATATVIRSWHRESTEFVGYEKLEAEAEVIGVEKETDRIHVVFSRTPFYARAGGQVGDTGTAENLARHGQAVIYDTVRHEAGATLHYVQITSGQFRKGDRCQLTVDANRRKQIQRNHTATHLLHAALREVLGEHVVQAGSYVSDDELRFDFSHFEKVTPEELARVEDLANTVVMKDLPVKTE
ncbi:alanine--tRNA ligase, partial [Candidatus Bipolaricaulota bacterium]|nr:alanine--tRNA ligase [Candidatus Bipolaricaulota bacterium]